MSRFKKDNLFPLVGNTYLVNLVTLYYNNETAKTPS